MARLRMRRTAAAYHWAPPGDGSANKVDRSIDKIEKAAKASDRSPAVMKDAREAEASLRDCGGDEDASDAADQLDKLTD